VGATATFVVAMPVAFCQPAGFEGFVREFSTLRPDLPPDFDQIRLIAQKWEIDILPERRALESGANTSSQSKQV
jgi:hypothetical protein